MMLKTYLSKYPKVITIVSLLFAAYYFNNSTNNKINLIKKQYSDQYELSLVKKELEVRELTLRIEELEKKESGIDAIINGYTFN